MFFWTINFLKSQVNPRIPLPETVFVRTLSTQADLEFNKDPQIVYQNRKLIFLLKTCNPFRTLHGESSNIIIKVFTVGPLNCLKYGKSFHGLNLCPF